MRRVIALATVSLLMLLAASNGCKKEQAGSVSGGPPPAGQLPSGSPPTEAEMIGKWKVVSVTGAEALGPAWADDLKSATLRLKADHTFRVWNNAMGGFGGTWSLSGSTLTTVVGDNEHELLSRAPRSYTVEGGKIKDGQEGSIITWYERLPATADVPAVTVTAAQFAADAKNKAVYDAKYVGKLIEVEGTVVRIDGSSNPYVLIAGPVVPQDAQKAPSVQCRTIDRYPQAWAAHGQKVKMRGLAFKDPLLIEAELAEAGPSTAVIIGAADLARAFAGDPEGAKKNYMLTDEIAKTMRITGPLLQKRDGDPTERFQILLGEPGAHVLCVFPSEKEIIAQLQQFKPGEVMTVVGEMDRYARTDLQIEQCLLTSLKIVPKLVEESPPVADTPDRDGEPNSSLIGQEAISIVTDPNHGASSVAVASDGNTIYAGAYSTPGGTWDLKTQKRVLTIPHSGGYGRAASAISPDGKWIACEDNFNDLRLFQLSDGKDVRTIQAHGSVTRIAFMPDSKTVVAAAGKRISGWNVETGEQTFSWIAEAEELLAMDLFPGGKQVATGGTENIIKIWDLPSGKLVKQFGPDKDKILCVRVTPDGKWVVSHTIFGHLRVYDVATGKKIRDRDPHNARIDGMCILHDGKTLAYPNFKDIVLWDMDKSRTAKILRGHTGNVEDVTVTSDGKRLISCAEDGTVKVWDVP